MHAAAFALALCLAQEQFGPAFSSREANYRVSYPRAWSRARAVEGKFQLGLTSNGNFIGILGGETPATPEAILRTIELEQKSVLEEFKPMGRVELKVSGERALQMRAQCRQQGIAMTMYCTVFSHQGIAYRVVGVHGTGRRDEFEKDYFFILDRFEFLAERKGWIERFVGKPARTAFLGGLGSLELNRPRWTESTFSEQSDWSNLEQLVFTLLDQGSWIRVRARESSLDAAAELDELGVSLAALLQKPVVTPFAVKLPGGDVACLEIRGVWQEHPYHFRAAVRVCDGIALRVWLEEYETQSEVTKKDWEQLLAGLRLEPRSKPASPPAFPLRSSAGSKKPDAGLAAVLGAAVRVAPPEPGVAALSPDGGRALAVDREQGSVLIDLAAGKRQLLDGLPAFTSASWSRDGKRIVLAGDEETLVATLEPFGVVKVPVPSVAAAFGPGEGEVLLCVPGGGSGREFRVSRLEVVRLEDGRRRTIVEFPLSRVGWPAVSPDGKRIALVTNRDVPRSAPEGGHLYVCDAEGKGLRALTDGSEDVSHVSWSADGASIYALRRRSVGEGGGVGDGGPVDLYRIPVEGGAPVNLTRSGLIDAAWSAGADFWVRVDRWSLPEGQRGVFRIGAAGLEKASSKRPVPAALDRRANGKAVAEKVQGVLGSAALREVVPTPELMEKVARAFADAAGEKLGIALDFKLDSLDRLWEAREALGRAGEEPLAILALGAYYGETLRREAGAQWRLGAVPFGAWAPGSQAEGNCLVDPVLPFSAACVSGLDLEAMGFRGAEDLQGRDEGRKILLVYPPAQVEEAVREATGPEYAEARRKLDAGEVKEALAILVRELQRRPMSRMLAAESIAICEAAGLEEAARTLTAQAVEAGNEVPELLIRHADGLAAKDPAAALEHYRKAVRGAWAPAESFLKLGKAYAATGARPLAEACWRRAFAGATPEQKDEICSLLGVPKPATGQE